MFENKLDIIERDGERTRFLSVRKKEKGAFQVLRAFESASPGELKSGQSGPKAVLFPREQCVLRALELKGGQSEIEALVLKETEEGLPFEKENALWDAELMTRSGDLSKVLFAAVSENYVKNFTKQIKDLEKPGFAILPSTMALYELLFLSGWDGSVPCLAVGISGSRTDMLAAADNTIVFSRGAERSLEPDAAVSAGEVLESLKRTGFKPSVIYSNSEQLNETLVKRGFTCVKLSLPESISSELKTAGADPQAFLLLAGAAQSLLSSGRFSVDLNKNRAKDKDNLKLLASIKKAGFALSAVFLAAALVFYFMGRSAENHLASQRAELSKLSGMYGKAWSGIVVDLSKAVPPQVILNEISTDTKGDVTVRGVSATRNGVTKFLDNVNGLPGFGAELAFANETGSGAKQMVQFQIKVRQRGGK